MIRINDERCIFILFSVRFRKCCNASDLRCPFPVHIHSRVSIGAVPAVNAIRMDTVAIDRDGTRASVLGGADRAGSIGLV